MSRGFRACCSAAIDATVYGVARLYTDFVALYEDEKVKEERYGWPERSCWRTLRIQERKARSPKSS